MALRLYCLLLLFAAAAEIIAETTSTTVNVNLNTLFHARTIEPTTTQRFPKPYDLPVKANVGSNTGTLLQLSSLEETRNDSETTDETSTRLTTVTPENPSESTIFTATTEDNVTTTQTNVPSDDATATTGDATTTSATENPTSSGVAVPVLFTSAASSTFFEVTDISNTTSSTTTALTDGSDATDTDDTTTTTVNSATTNAAEVSTTAMPTTAGTDSTEETLFDTTSASTMASEGTDLNQSPTTVITADMTTGVAGVTLSTDSAVSSTEMNDDTASTELGSTQSAEVASTTTETPITTTLTTAEEGRSTTTVIDPAATTTTVKATSSTTTVTDTEVTTTVASLSPTTTITDPAVATATVTSSSPTTTVTDPAVTTTTVTSTTKVTDPAATTTTVAIKSTTTTAEPTVTESTTTTTELDTTSHGTTTLTSAELPWSLRITSSEWQDAYSNINSEASKKFIKDLHDELNEVFKVAVNTLHGWNITHLKKGSVVVGGTIITNKAESGQEVADKIRKSIDINGGKMGDFEVDVRNITVGGHKAAKQKGGGAKSGSGGYVVGIVLAITLAVIVAMVIGLVVFNHKQQTDRRMRDYDYMVDDTPVTADLGRQNNTGNRASTAFEMTETLPASDRRSYAQTNYAYYPGGNAFSYTTKYWPGDHYYQGRR